MTKKFNTTKYALGILKREMVTVTDYGWAWHNNIVAVLHDKGMGLTRAHRTAADVMKQLFGVDTALHEDYPATQAGRKK